MNQALSGESRLGQAPLRVFLSFKNQKADGSPTPEQTVAGELHRHLTAKGCTVFFSPVTLERMGQANYKQAIDDELDAADVLVAVGSSRANLDSGWVRYEWDSFFHDMLSGLKPHGRVFVYLIGESPQNLPRALRQTQCIVHGPDGFASLTRFLLNYQNPTQPVSVAVNSVSAKYWVATLKDGKELRVLDRTLREGTFKRVYFTEDGGHVVKLFKDTVSASTAEHQARIAALVSYCNPTMLRQSGGMADSQAQADEWAKLFCWPFAIVLNPSAGVVAPSAPSRYRFLSGVFAGRDKMLAWFLKPKTIARLPTEEQGTLRQRIAVCRRIARSVQLLHGGSFCLNDLSPRNILVDFPSGTSVIVDIEEASLPGFRYSGVLGTMGYLAPEQVMTLESAGARHTDTKPSRHTEEYALAVIIYETLLRRHPLRGPKVHVAESAEQDEMALLGRNALFIEDPTDMSNTPPGLAPPLSVLGPNISTLMFRAFVRGLTSPEARPSAEDWEKALALEFAAESDGICQAP